jgi:hypothetical protein
MEGGWRSTGGASGSTGSEKRHRWGGNTRRFGGGGRGGEARKALRSDTASLRGVKDSSKSVDTAAVLARLAAVRLPDDGISAADCADMLVSVCGHVTPTGPFAQSACNLIVDVARKQLTLLQSRQVSIVLPFTLACIKASPIGTVASCIRAVGYIIFSNGDRCVQVREFPTGSFCAIPRRFFFVIPRFSELE